MKKIVAVFCLLLCTASLQAKDKPVPADFNVKIHIAASRIETECFSGLCRNVLYADTVLNGKKIVFLGNAVIYQKQTMLLVPGDYPAKLTKDSQNPDTAWFSQEYDVLLPDGTIWHCTTSGISE